MRWFSAKEQDLLCWFRKYDCYTAFSSPVTFNKILPLRLRGVSWGSSGILRSALKGLSWPGAPSHCLLTMAHDCIIADTSSLGQNELLPSCWCDRSLIKQDTAVNWFIPISLTRLILRHETVIIFAQPYKFNLLKVVHWRNTETRLPKSFQAFSDVHIQHQHLSFALLSLSALHVAEVHKWKCQWNSDAQQMKRNQGSLKESLIDVLGLLKIWSQRGKNLFVSGTFH